MEFEVTQQITFIVTADSGTDAERQIKYWCQRGLRPFEVAMSAVTVTQETVDAFKAIISGQGGRFIWDGNEHIVAATTYEVDDDRVRSVNLCSGTLHEILYRYMVRELEIGAITFKM